MTQQEARVGGASFKGNLEVLNLSDIFQSLAMNRHSGTLVVGDGKREKKVFFAEGEISLLSSSRRLKLGELLIAAGKITEEDLDLALKLQKQNRKKLGEILVEEGFCEEDDIAKIVRCQIEEEIYDLFLWRKAEFEFIADFMPDDLKRNSPNIMRLTLNTNALIMEALRRLDEWDLIKKAVPSTKEIFVIVDRGKVDQVELPERLRAHVDQIDGKTSVEGIAEKALVSEFELCKCLADMVQANAIRALDPNELVQKADEAYALNEHVAAAALYARLAELIPGEAKVLIPLADSLRRSGDDRQALQIYEEIAKKLDPARDLEKLRRCYEAILALEPGRNELAKKLEALDERARRKAGRGVKKPLVLLVVVAVVGGVVLFHDRIKHFLNIGGENESKLREDEKAAEDLYKVAEFKQKEAEAALVTDVARFRELARQWWTSGREIITKYPKTKVAQQVSLPTIVTTEPPGFEVYLVMPDGATPKGQTTAKAPLVSVTFVPLALRSDRVTIQVKRRPVRGRPDKVIIERTFPVSEWHDELIVIEDAHDFTCGTEAPVESEIAIDEGKLIATSRAGHVHVVETFMPADRSVRLEVGALGDILTGPGVIRKEGERRRALVGTVDHGLVEIDLATRKVATDRFPAESPVSGRPLVTANRVVFATQSGQVLGYPLEGGKPAWEKWTEGTLAHAGALHEGGMAVFAAQDEHLYAFNTLLGHPVWPPCALKARPTGAPCAFQDQIIVPVEGGGLVAVSADGKLTAERYVDPRGRPVRTIAASDSRLIVATDDGHVRALGAGFKPLWANDFERPVKEAIVPRVTIMGSWVMVSLDGRKIYGVDEATGGLVWIGTVPSGVVSSPISVQGEFIAVGTSLSDVLLFRRPQ